MRYTYLELENYIGVYNGMGLTNIRIDLSQCRYRTLIIRGENGSGKSTIFNAMNVFPDGNSSFIPGKPAKKIICLLDRDILYTIKFFHGIKNNGERETTKAYISKNINGMDIELNENGNVSSFKDILYNEFSLDPNFASLSQLSMDDKGLADKKPAERKKFVNSIIESLEVYNDIYKAISKKSGNIKSMMDNLVVKLGSVGDINMLDRALADIEREINSLNEQKDLATKELMKHHATISILDPDNSIQNKFNELSLRVASSHRELKTLMEHCQYSLIGGPAYSLEVASSQLKEIVENINSLEKELNMTQQSYNQTLSYYNDISRQIEEKEAKLASIDNQSNYQDALDKLTLYQAEVKEYSETLAVTGIDPNAFTKDEYILALETLKDIKTSVDIFRSAFDYEIIGEAVDTYERLNWPSMAPLKNSDSIHERITQLQKLEEDCSKQLNEAGMAMEAIKKLNERPKSCHEDSCCFISDLLQQQKKYPLGSFDKLNETLLSYISEEKELRDELDEINIFNSCVNQMRIVIRDIDKNGAILSRLPNGGIFSSKIEFFKHLLTGDDFSYVEQLYRYIDFANILDMYHASFRLMKEYKQQVDLYASKSDILDDLTSEISILKEKQIKYSAILKEQREMQSQLSMKIDSERVRYDLINQSIIPSLNQMKGIVDQIEFDNSNIQSIQSAMAKINECNGHIHYCSDQIVALTNQIAPKMRQRDEIKFKINQAEQYAQELQQLQEQYDRYEIIKHYSSPTKGIQLVFMELYMGKILHLANELLSFLFNGEYQIQPFIINESEFRIPCLGSGYLNDDISSMSSSQLTMISMILSFSLLHTSSTKYNIIKMDEIDGPLDENNRIMFIDVMNRIMDIMNVEQCVMISHSSELQVDTSDVILLKSSQLSTDYLRGNIVWKY